MQGGGFCLFVLFCCYCCFFKIVCWFGLVLGFRSGIFLGGGVGFVPSLKFISRSGLDT